jgi:hypothetical protein
VSICEVKEGSKLSIELDPELSILRHEPDLVDELADAFGGLEAGVLVIQGFGEIGDLLAVELGKVRMQARHGRRRCFKPSQELHAPGLQHRHLVLNSGAGHARLDGFDQPADLAFGLFEIARGAIAAPLLFGPPPVHFSVEFVDEGRDEVWLHQLVLKADQHRGFEPVSSYRD